MSSISSLDNLYESLEKICPKELAKLQSSDAKEKHEALQSIVKKVLLTEKSGTVEFTNKPKLWAIVHFFRKLVGYSTKEHTHLDAALAKTRAIFTETPTDKTKYDAMRQILNAVILTTGSGKLIHQRNIRAYTPCDTTQVEDLGKKILSQDSSPATPPAAPPVAPPPPAAVPKKQEPIAHNKKEVIDTHYKVKPHEMAPAIRISPQQLEACFAHLESIGGDQDIPKLERGIAQLATQYENKLTAAYDVNKQDARKDINALLVARRDKDDSEDIEAPVARKGTQSLLAKAAEIEFADLKKEAMEILKFDLPQSLDAAQKLVKGGLKALVAKKEAAFNTFYNKVTARREEVAQVQKQATNAYKKMVEVQIDPKMQYLEKTVNEAKQAFDRDIRALKSDLDKTTSDLDAARKSRLTNNLGASGIKKLEAHVDSLQKQIEDLTKDQKAFTDVTTKAIAALREGIRVATPNNENWKESLEAVRDAIVNIAPESNKPISDRIPEILQKSTDTLAMLRQNDLKVRYQKVLVEFPALILSGTVLSKAQNYLLKEKDILSQLTSSANGKYVPTLVHTLQQNFPLVAKNFPSSIHSFHDLRSAIQTTREELKNVTPDQFVKITDELTDCYNYIINTALPTLATLDGIEQLETQNNALRASTDDPLVTQLLTRQRDFLALPNAKTIVELNTFLQQADDVQTHQEILKQLTNFIEDPDEHASAQTLKDITTLLETRKADFTPKLLLTCCQTINSRTGKASAIKLPTDFSHMKGRQPQIEPDTTNDDEWN
ncbi:MAG: hypothetical protein LLF94_07575 [Chlamydiales bacterium]|nr:hypothetical protein [Chlamydiales bacterium]